jgi:hypothetical protein
MILQPRPMVAGKEMPRSTTSATDVYRQRDDVIRPTRHKVRWAQAGMADRTMSDAV